MRKTCLLFVILLLGCTSGKQLKDFTSDGCTLFPDRSIINEQDWCECCFEHDLMYWQGGTEEQRLIADKGLKDCVLEKTGNTELAEIMYAGVRFGGSPYFYNWYRWGYGWSYNRKYKELSLKEQKMVKIKLARYFQSKLARSCEK